MNYTDLQELVSEFSELPLEERKLPDGFSPMAGLKLLLSHTTDFGEIDLFCETFGYHVIAEHNGISVEELLSPSRQSDVDFPVELQQRYSYPGGPAPRKFAPVRHKEAQRALAAHFASEGLELISDAFDDIDDADVRQLFNACCVPENWTDVQDEGFSMAEPEEDNGVVSQDWFLIPDCHKLLVPVVGGDHDFFVGTISWDANTGDIISVELEIR